MRRLRRPERKPKSSFILTKDDWLHITKLPKVLTVPLELRHKGGKYTAIAEQLGCPIGTVRSRIHRARREIERLRAADMGGIGSR